MPLRYVLIVIGNDIMDSIRIVFIDVDQHVVADFSRLENQFVQKLNEGGVGVFEIADFYWLQY